MFTPGHCVTFKPGLQTSNRSSDDKTTYIHSEEVQKNMLQHAEADLLPHTIQTGMRTKMQIRPRLEHTQY